MATATPLPDINELAQSNDVYEESDMTHNEQILSKPAKVSKNTRNRSQTPRPKRARDQVESSSSLDETIPTEYEQQSLQDIIDSRIGVALLPARREMDEMKKEIKELKDENHRLSDRCIKLDSQARKKNLKIWGLLEGTKETRLDLKGQVLSLLSEYGIELNYRDLDSAFRLGAKDSQITRCTLVQFVHMEDKERTLSKGRQMYIDYKVRLDDDYPTEIEDKRKDLKTVLHAANRTRNEAGQHKYRTALHADRLTINGQRYTVNTVNRLPDELKLENISTQQKDGITAFFTKHSPLSNHHTAEQEVEGTKYTSNEQYYMHQQASTFGDPATAENVLKEKDPKVQKNLCKKFKKLDQTAWNNRKLNVMRIGLHAKFSQNPHLKTFLLNTKDTNILECNKFDSFWGIGMAMNNPEIWIRNSWAGKAKNQLGALLMDLRTELKRAY